MAENRTRPTGASVAAHLASRASDEQKKDCRTLMAIFRKVTGQRTRMWGPSIVGYGSYRYTYDSGRTGEMCLAAFAIRGRELVVYLEAEIAGRQALMARLGKHRIGKCCLYVRRLADIDTSILEQLIVESMALTRRRYG
jgi:hypothetical protein